MVGAKETTEVTARQARRPNLWSPRPPSLPRRSRKPTTLFTTVAQEGDEEKFNESTRCSRRLVLRRESR